MKIAVVRGCKRLTEDCVILYFMEVFIMSVFDHTGAEFETEEAMCKHWGISMQVYRTRRAHGWELEKILTAPDSKWVQQRKLAKKCMEEEGKVDARKECEDAFGFKDHTGKRFSSLKKMCSYYGVSTVTFYDRATRGESLRDCLKPTAHTENTHWVDAELKSSGNEVSNVVAESSATTDGVRCYDHEGRVFSSEFKMCEYWGVPVNVYYLRRVRGFTLGEALTATMRKADGCFDYLGRRYDSEEQMFAAYGVSADVYFMRRAMGLSMKEALVSKFGTEI